MIIREAVAEEVQSLGASFVELEIEAQDDSDSGGYAKALVAEKAKQQTKIARSLHWWIRRRGCNSLDTRTKGAHFDHGRSS